MDTETRNQTRRAHLGDPQASIFHDAVPKTHITAGQLDAIAMRCREELDASLRRSGTAATATIKESILTVCVEHSLAAAEQNLMRRAAGREFFQRYIEELAEQIYPSFARHVEHILPYAVTYTRVKVDCDQDSIIFTFGLRPRPRWAHSIRDMHTVAAHEG
ncbi:MAG: Na-translocating system protein MpsC family protein [Caldilineaceae bacterium]